MNHYGGTFNVVSYQGSTVAYTSHALSPAVVQLAALIPREYRVVNAHPKAAVAARASAVSHLSLVSLRGCPGFTPLSVGGPFGKVGVGE